MSGQDGGVPQSGLNGWVEGVLYNVAIAVMSVVYAYASRSGAHVFTFILYSMLFGSLAMVLLTGPGDEALAIMLSPRSWIVGVNIIGMEVVYFLLVGFVAPADGSLMIRISIPLSLVIGLLLLGRRVTPLGWVGAAIVTAGVLLVMGQLELPRQWPALACALGCAVIINLRTFATELHPWNRRARTVWEKMRVTGLVVVATSLAGLMALVAAVGLVQAGVLPSSPLIPAPHHFWHAPTLMLAVLVGATIYSALNYFGFSSVVKIGSENFIATAAFTPLATLLAQQMAELAGLMRFAKFDWRLFPSIALAVLGVLIIVWAGASAKRKAGG